MLGSTDDRPSIRSTDDRPSIRSDGPLQLLPLQPIDLDLLDKFDTDSIDVPLVVGISPSGATSTSLDEEELSHLCLLKGYEYIAIDGSRGSLAAAGNKKSQEEEEEDDDDGDANAGEALAWLESGCPATVQGFDEAAFAYRMQDPPELLGSQRRYRLTCGRTAAWCPAQGSAHAYRLELPQKPRSRT